MGGLASFNIENGQRRRISCVNHKGIPEVFYYYVFRKQRMTKFYSNVLKLQLNKMFNCIHED